MDPKDVANRVIQRLPAPVRKAVRKRVISQKRSAGVPTKPAGGQRPPYDALRWARELATNPLFTAASHALVRQREAEARAANPQQAENIRHFRMTQVNLTLRAPEIESIRDHGIVPLTPQRLSGSETPPDDVCFVTVTNDKYAPGVEALVLSLLRQYPGMRAPVIVFHDGTLSDFSIGRMKRLYEHLRFEHRSTDPYDLGQIGSSVNHQRVGLLGYLSIEILGLEGFSRAILLDADTVVLNDLSALWHGDRIQVVADHGVLPFGLVANATGRPIVNSGMISFPASELGPQKLAEAHAKLPLIDSPVDVLLDNFADQKFWNVFLAGKDVAYVPMNFNTNKAFVDRHFPDALADVALLHMTGPKPWYDFSDQDLVTEDDKVRLKNVKSVSRSTFAVWNQGYLSAITSSRIGSFRDECGPELAKLHGSAAGRPAVLIGNGPSLKQTDLSLFRDFESFSFNWFVNHDDFDEVRPDHLVLASHMLFGGWHTTRPTVPADFLAALTRHEHRPRIWTSYYFKDVVEATPELAGHDVSYFLFEKPFKEPVTRRGTVGLDLLSPLVDCNTGVLTAAVPIALHLGVDRICLVGCDSDYSSAAGSYFYDAASHTSRTTNEQQLVNTWVADGAGQFGYRRTAEELAGRGVRIVDATVGGKLTVLEKLPLAQVRDLLGD